MTMFPPVERREPRRRAKPARAVSGRRRTRLLPFPNRIVAFSRRRLTLLPPPTSRDRRLVRDGGHARLCAAPVQRSESLRGGGKTRRRRGDVRTGACQPSPLIFSSDSRHSTKRVRALGIVTDALAAPRVKTSDSTRLTKTNLFPKNAGVAPRRARVERRAGIVFFARREGASLGTQEDRVRRVERARAGAQARRRRDALGARHVASRSRQPVARVPGRRSRLRRRAGAGAGSRAAGGDLRGVRGQGRRRAFVPEGISAGAHLHRHLQAAGGRARGARSADAARRLGRRRRDAFLFARRRGAGRGHVRRVAGGHGRGVGGHRAETHQGARVVRPTEEGVPARRDALARGRGCRVRALRRVAVRAELDRSGDEKESRQGEPGRGAKPARGGRARRAEREVCGEGALRGARDVSVREEARERQRAPGGEHVAGPRLRGCEHRRTRVQRAGEDMRVHGQHIRVVRGLLRGGRAVQLRAGD